MQKTHSLARFRHHSPPLPCRVGGQFLRLGEACFLRDALGGVRLLGPTDLWRGIATGDQVVVYLVRREPVATGEVPVFHCEQVRREVQAQGEPADLRVGQAPQFSRFLRVVRDFFIAHGLSEVATPTLVPCPGLEPTLEPFALVGGKFYLPTSPEIHLKKALTRGWTDIFELRPCFRQEDFSSHHAREFWMLEWYRGFADLEIILQDLGALLHHLATQGFGRAQPLQVTTFAALFQEVLQFQLRPKTTMAELRELCARLGLVTSPEDTFNDIFHRLWLERFEPILAERGPLVVRDFPPSQAALARLNSAGWADRFELYWNGLEIANAFNEVHAPDEQSRRWDIELQERQRLRTSPLPRDEGLIQALRQGMPPSGGIALGLERLFMACTGTREIRELTLFGSGEGASGGPS